MKNTAKKRDAVRVVFDNSQNDGMSDDELIGYLRRSQAFKNGSVYIIDSDSALVRIRLPVSVPPVGGTETGN